MRAYWELMRAGFRRWSRYRGALLAALFTNTVFGWVRASMLLTAIATAGGPVGGYDAVQAATYVWLGQGLLGPVDIWGATVDVGARVKTGDIAVDLSRPTSVLGAALATNYGRAVFGMLPRLLPMLAMGALTTGLSLPTSPLPYLQGVVSLLLAISLVHCYYYAVGLSALWTVENRGFVTIAMVVQSVLCGFVVPISWLPPWLQHVAAATPFPAMFQTPLDLLSGRTTGPHAWGLLGLQVLWTAVLVLATLAVLRSGRRKVVIQGG